MPEASPHRIHGEYWITPSGVQPVKNDGGHEMEVVEEARRRLRDLLGVAAPWGETDESDLAAAFRAFLRARSLACPTTKDELSGAALAQLSAEDPPAGQTARTLAPIAEGFRHADPREYAMRQWNWIRVDGATVEAWRLCRSGARELREQLLNLLFDYEGADDEAEANAARVSLHVHTAGHFVLSVAEIGDPDNWFQAAVDVKNIAAGRTATAQIRQLEAAALAPCYAGILGD